MPTRMSGNIDSAIKRLTQAGIGEDDARFDISLIFSYTGDDAELFEKAVTRRAEGEPVAYIIGRQAFYKEEYKVTPDVLIPRADTELLVETALGFAGALGFAAGDLSEVPEYSGSKESLRILDLCTGTGCVGISVINTLLEKHITASAVLSDVSGAALDIARENIGTSCKDPGSVTVVRLDVMNEDPADGLFDIITANPPYINSGDMTTLDREVKDHEPALALQGGEDGLMFYPHICNIALKCLNKGGMLAVEHGYDQGDDVREILINKGFNNVKTLKDFGGNDRVTFGIL